MTHRLPPAIIALLVAGLFWAARRHLAGVASPEMSAWPSHVIFGLYFAVFTLALQALHRLMSEGPARPQQTLLMLLLACVCCDLVLVNVQEVLARADASYGLVVIWDMATFFIWLRAIEVASAHGDERFALSAAAAIAPVLALGREILFLPYGARAERAYLDLAFGNGVVALWPLATAVSASAGPLARGLGRLGRALVFCGCLYWLCNAAENLLFLAWPPLPKSLYALAAAHGVAVYWLSVGYAAFALLATIALRALAPNTAARFALR